MSFQLIGRHGNAVRHPDVRAAIAAVESTGCVSSFAIGKIRRVKHSRASGSIEIKSVTPGGLRIAIYAPNIIVEGVGR